MKLIAKIMSQIIENKAKNYLFNEFINENFLFKDKLKGEIGFDIWLIDKNSEKSQKIELKATEGKYSKKSDIFQKLYFSALNEKDNFNNKETKILRIFLGNNPPRLFIFDNEIFSKGAKFEPEGRWVIKGVKNYDVINEIL